MICGEVQVEISHMHCMNQGEKISKNKGKARDESDHLTPSILHTVGY